MEQSYEIIEQGTDRETLVFNCFRYWLDITGDPQNSIGWLVTDDYDRSDDWCTVSEVAEVPGAREYVIERTEQAIERAAARARENGWSAEPVTALRAELEAARSVRPVGGGAPDGDVGRFGAELAWVETVDAGGEPVTLTGECSVEIGGAHSDGGAELFWFPVSGAPDTFDEQLDAALGAQGWRRLDDLNSWSDDNGAHATTQVGRA